MRQRSSFRKNTFDLSPEIHHMAKQEELGELCKVYPVSKHSTTIWAGGIACIVLGGMLNVVLIFITILLSTIPPTPGIEPTSTDAILVLWATTIPGFIFLMVGFYLIFSKRIYFPWCVSRWQYGFIYEKKQIIKIFRWNQIESVQASVSQVPNGRSPIVYECKVRRQDGYEVTLGNVFSDIPELIDIVLEESARQLGPQQLSIASPKGISTFAHLKLDRQGISNTQETLSWQEIQEFMTNDGTVTLRKKAE
jgi:hypothetical protein